MSATPESPVAARPLPDQNRLLQALAADIDRFAETVHTGDLYRLFWIKLKAVDTCNLRCIMCNHWRRPTLSEISSDRMTELIGELADLGTRLVILSGGEPTLLPGLPELIRSMTTAGMFVVVYTNGVRLSADYVSRLALAGLARVGLSLHSADPALHDQMSGVDGAWEKAVHGAGHLSKLRPRPELSLNVVLTSVNVVPGLPDLVALAADLGACEIGLSPVATSHLPASARALIPSPEQVRSFRHDYLPEMIATGKRLGVKVTPEGGDPKQATGARQHIAGTYQDRSRTCYLPWYHCTISHDGEVGACCQMRDKEGEGYLGNILDAPLADALRGNAARRVRLRMRSGKLPAACTGCTMHVRDNRLIDSLLTAAQRP